MTMIKRIISAILVLVLMLSLISCGEYVGNAGSGGGTQKPPSSGNGGESNDDPSDDFTVQLMLEGQPFCPETAVSVFWNDGYSYHIAKVDDSGFASIDGLDGDYSVTLSSVPAGYAYDANAYTATNDNRNIIIEMKDLNMLRGAGTSIDKCYQISEPGVYTVTVKEAGDLSYIRFAPQSNGTYTVESWVSASEDEINPVCMAYLGSSQYVYGEYRVTDVGACGSYTRNFIHTVNIADDNISSSGGGSQTFLFAVGAEPKSGVYPVNITFAVKWNGGWGSHESNRTTIIPEQDWSAFDFDAFNDLAGGELVGAQTLYPNTDSSYIFDEDKYKVWSVSEGGDGVYHVYDKELYPDTNGYGPILVAYINIPCEYLPGASFAEIDTIGFGALSKVQGMYNYKVFIEGFAAAANAGYYCVDDCLCHVDGSLPACAFGCLDCTKDCTNADPAIMNVKGYSDLCNADGVAPVTPELALFFQRYAEGQRFFADGGGIVDGYYPVDAYEDSQWLFACAYYEE